MATNMVSTDAAAHAEGSQERVADGGPLHRKSSSGLRKSNLQSQPSQGSSGGNRATENSKKQKASQRTGRSKRRQKEKKHAKRGMRNKSC